MSRDPITAEFLELCELYSINSKTIAENVPGQSMRTAERWFSEPSAKISPIVLAWLKLFIDSRGLRVLHGNNARYSTVNIGGVIYYPAEYIADVLRIKKETLLKKVSAGIYAEDLDFVKRNGKTYFTEIFFKNINK